ncbi:hypothetical protein N2152v2_000677 [Parachlorella kessleri]
MYVARGRTRGAVEVIQILVAAGASAEERDRQGQTAIMYAAQGDSADAIRALVAAGASINARDNRGRTALHGFARHGQQAATFQALLEAGADINAADAEGVTVLLAAVKAVNAEAASLITKAGADLDAANSGNTPALLAAVKEMCSTEQELQALGAQGDPLKPLRHFFGAARSGDVKSVIRLASLPPPADVDINAVGGAGVHCTHLLAASVSEGKKWGWELDPSDWCSLLAAGADVAGASKTYPTPLDLMLFENGLEWLQWNENATAIVRLVGELAAAGCPVDTRLPARCGNPGLRPPTLETWLARLAEHGWPSRPADIRRTLQVSRALLRSAATQGSQGRPEQVAVVQKVLPVVAAPPKDTATAMPRDPPTAGNKRRPRKSSKIPKAATSTSQQLVSGPRPAVLCNLRLERGRFTRASVCLRAQPTLPSTAPLARVGFKGCF